MTALRPTLRLAGFQSSLKQALEVDNRTIAAESLKRDVPRPERLSDDDWVGLQAAIRFAYQAASQDGVEAVIEDVKRVMKDDLTSDDLDALQAIVTQSDVVDRRQQGLRVRDGFLPSLVGASLTLDLRVIEPTDPQEGGVEVAPVVLARLEFDEQVAGQEGIVFQMTGATLDEFTEDLLKLRKGLSFLTSQVTPTIRVPDWAREVSQ